MLKSSTDADKLLPKTETETATATAAATEAERLNRIARGSVDE